MSTGKENKLFVVVHVEEVGQALRNAKIAFDNGADGIFLINHSMMPEMLRAIYEEVRDEHPHGWVGLNYLGVSRSRAIELLPKDAGGLWMDTPGFVEDGSNIGVQEVRERIHRASDGALFFGGFDFKYQIPVRDLSRATLEISEVVDVITTSGSATGSPPSMEKMRTMRLAAPDARIAIASGMTPGNVDPYLDLVNYFLVATGISSSHTELDPGKVHQMARRVHR